MLVRHVITNAQTGEVTEEWLEVSGVVSEVQGVANDQANAQATATATANGDTLRGQADAALANLRAFRDLASPTNAQTVAAVKLLCSVAIALIRLALNKLDGTN